MKKLMMYKLVSDCLGIYTLKVLKSIKLLQSVNEFSAKNTEIPRKKFFGCLTVLWVNQSHIHLLSVQR